jgi:hypothetical protein
MRRAYIILSHSNTLPARIIRFFTGKYYNHVSFGFSKDLKEIYSFGRKYPRFIYPGGFITEGVKSGYFGLHPGTKIAVMEINLSRRETDRIKAKIEKFIKNRNKFKYGLWHTVRIYFGKIYRDDKKYVCSVFVAYLLKDSFDLGKDYSLIMPEDFYILNAKIIYEGTRGGYCFE